MPVEYQSPPHDPRTRPGRPPKYLDVLNELKENRGEWAILERYDEPHRAYNLASNLRRGIVRKPPGTYEFTAQRTGQVWTVFARFLSERTTRKVKK